MAKRRVALEYITEENFMEIAQKIKKFLSHDIVMWHSFDCGAKRHIPTTVMLPELDGWKEHKSHTFYRYSSPIITIVTPETDPRFSNRFIRVSLAHGYGGVIYIGDKVGFTGNRMHLRTSALPLRHKYCYEVYQLWDENGGFKNLKPTPDDYMEELFYDM